MPQERRKSRQQRLAIVSMMFFMLIYLALAIVCLWQWGAPNPLSRIDLFSGGALVLSVLLGLEQLTFALTLPQQEEVKREAFGMNYDPGMAKWISLLALAELIVFLDYGHWHFAPILENRTLQGAGLGLYIASLCWLRWVDLSLARHFSGMESKRQVITAGAFHYIRHPRYAGLITSRVAFALVFASPVGWLLVVGWILVVQRRITLEESHLQAIFGEEYSAYKLRSARLLPRFY